MSRKLIDRSLDLKRLENDGFDLEIRGGFLLIHGIPYVNSKKEIAYGILVSPLELAGEKTAEPSEHVAHFVGDHPCQSDGSIITAIQNESRTKDLGDGVVIHHTFSNKFSNRNYKDYHEKITRYVSIILHEAQAIDPGVKPLSPRDKDLREHESVFLYPDTNSSRAEIGAISAKLRNQKVAIIGLGGTGSYVLDFVCKTHVGEIHIFDGDHFLNHNAFRAPGAASLEKLDQKLRKVRYLDEIYSKMRRFIVPHDYHVTPENIDELSGMAFVFVCVDKPTEKKPIIEKLIERSIPFVDAGIGITVVDGALTGSVRVTTSTKDKHDHVHTRVSLADAPGDNDYSLNIQIAELNALNAALAVIKWKKLHGFYHDLEKEHHCSYSININKIVNDETVT